MTALIDFGSLPPEVNSGLMYTGAGSAPLTAAATALSGLADQLGSAAHACTTVLDGLSGSAWQGPSAAAMAAAAARYVTWLRAVADDVAHAASSATTSVSAYHTAFAAIVPPPVIATNRAHLTMLVATNLLSQNSAAIAATEAAYAAMWAQDAVTMDSYAAEAAAAAVLSPLTAPPAITAADGPANPAAAATASTPSTSGIDPNNLLDPANASSTTGLSGLLNMLSGQTNSALGDSLNSMLADTVFSGGLLNPQNFIKTFTDFDYLLIYAFQDMVQNALRTSVGGDMAGGVISTMGSSTTAPTSPGALGTLVGHRVAADEVTASVGKASLVRAMSVPPSWAGLAGPSSAIIPAATAHLPATTAASPVISAGLPRSISSSMVDRTEDEKERPPAYGLKTKSFGRTPAGG